MMKALILNGSLRKEEMHSNTTILCSMLADEMSKYDVETEHIYLRNVDLSPGAKLQPQEPDDSPELFKKILDADILVFATPIWWDNHSSLIQAVIERLSWVDDYYIDKDFSPLYGKIFGCIVNGSGDGVQHINASLFNFASQLGFVIPPEAGLNYLGGDGEKNIRASKTTMMKLSKTARNLAFYADAATKDKQGLKVQAIKTQPYTGVKVSE
jgi:multimeric flavodoxin WrbA